MGTLGVVDGRAETVGLRGGSAGFYARRGKRWFDAGLALVGLVLLAVPMAVIAVCIGLADGRPILFRQERVGRHGGKFKILKFRTMTHRCEAGSTITVRGDSRVTPIGKWLRRLKLDELPQLWNVLTGNMSFVGPRPDVPGYMDRLHGEAVALLELRPGITGPASVAFRDEEAILARVEDPRRYNDEVVFPQKVDINLQYMRNLSLGLDLYWILRTLIPPEGGPESDVYKHVL